MLGRGWLRYCLLLLLAVCLGTTTVKCSQSSQLWIFDLQETQMATDSNTITFFSSPYRSVLFSAHFTKPPPPAWTVIWWLKYDNINGNTQAVNTPAGFFSDCPSGNPSSCYSGVSSHASTGAGTIAVVGYDTEPWNNTPSWEWSNTAPQCNTPGTCTMAGTWATGTTYALNAIVQCAQGVSSVCSAANGNMYISLENGNVGNDPSNSATACSGSPCWQEMMLDYPTLEASINAFTARAHASGFKTACMPASSLFRSSMNAGFLKGQTDWDTYIESGVIAATAAGCDIYEFQIQGSQYDLQVAPQGKRTYWNYATRWALAVYAANPSALALSGLSTFNFTLNTPATPAQICAAANLDPQSVNGFWLNIVNQPSVFSGAMACLAPPTPAPTPTPTPTPTPGPLTATPNPLPTFRDLVTSQSLTLFQNFYTGSLSLAGCTGVVTIAPSTGTGPALLSTITPVANGSCNLTGTGYAGGTTTIPVVVATPTPVPAYPYVVPGGHLAGDAACVTGNNPVQIAASSTGNLIILYARQNTSVSLLPPSGFTQLDVQNTPPNEAFLEAYEIATTNSGPQTVNAVSNCHSGRFDYHTLVIANESQSVPFDDHQILRQTLSGTTGPFSTTTATASQANDLPIANIEAQCCDPISVASTSPSSLFSYGPSGQFVNYLFTDNPTSGSGSYGPDSMTLAANNGPYPYQIQVVDLISPVTATPTPQPTPTPKSSAYMGAAVANFGSNGATQEAAIESLESSLGRYLGTDKHFFYFGNLGPTPPPNRNNQGYLTQAQMSQDQTFVGTNGVGGDCNTTRIPVLSWRVGDNFTTIANSNATDNAIIDAAATGLNWLRDTCGKSTVFLLWGYEFNLDRDGSGTNNNYPGMFTQICATITSCTQAQTKSQQTEFVAAQEYVHTRLLADGVTNMLQVVVSSNWNGGSQLLGFFPPASAGFTWNGFDVYDNNCNGYASVTQKAYAGLSGLGRPIGIFEAGEDTSGTGICSQQQFITDATNAILPNGSQPLMQLFEYFSGQGNPGHLNWTLNAGGITALTAMGCQAFFGGCGSPGPLTVTPTSQSIGTIGATANQNVAKTNYTGTLTLSLGTCSGIVSLSATSGTGPSFNSTVTAVSTGSCALSAGDGGVDTPISIPVTVTSGISYTFQGCTIYGGNDPIINNNISTATPSPDSAAIIAKLPGGTFNDAGDETFHYQINLATNSTPTFLVQPKSSTHNPPMDNGSGTRVPFQSSYHIESTSDMHAFVFNTDTCLESEMYQTTFQNSILSIFAGYNTDTTQPYLASANYGIYAKGGTNAAHITWIGTFLPGDDELLPVINHPLLLSVPTTNIVQWMSQNGYYVPATTGYTSLGGCLSACLHLGDIVQLNPNFDCTGNGTVPAAGQRICAAWKTFGAYVSDAGCCWKIRYGFASDGSNPWNYPVNIAPLFRIITMQQSVRIIHPGALKCSGTPCI